MPLCGERTERSEESEQRVAWEWNGLCGVMDGSEVSCV